MSRGSRWTKSGSLRDSREFGAAYALVGALLFDLALARRIDTGAEHVRIIGTGPTGRSHRRGGAAWMRKAFDAWIFMSGPKIPTVMVATAPSPPASAAGRKAFSDGL